jgi:hypothetical protein
MERKIKPPRPEFINIKPDVFTVARKQTLKITT